MNAVAHNSTRRCRRRRQRGGLCDGTSYLCKNRELSEFFHSCQEFARTEFKALVFQIRHERGSYELPAYIYGDVPNQFDEYTRAVWPTVLNSLYRRENPMMEVLVYWEAECVCSLPVFMDSCPDCRQV